MRSTSSAAVEQVLAGAGGLDEEILALVDLADRVEAALVEWVGVFDAAEGWKADGAYSFACWLRARADLTRTDGSRLSRLARLLRTMPITERALDGGKLSVAKARLLAGVINERTRAKFDEHEGFLVDQVQGLDVDNAKIALAHWKRLADPDGPDPGDPTRNRASLTTGIDGRWHLDADFDPVSGAVLQSVLQATTDRMHQDGRFNDLGTDNGPGRRQADAIIEMAVRSSGRNPDQPTVHPDLVIVIPHGWLHDQEPDPQAERPELLGLGPVSWDDVIRLAPLGTVSALSLDEAGRPVKLGRKERFRSSLLDTMRAAAAADGDDAGRPLNMGRDERLATSDQWIVLRHRDRGCVVPGCHRPASWCQAHHLQLWSNGGPTDLDNLCLVCSHHHHLIHDQGWTIHQDPDRTWHLTRPDGTPVPRPRYPGHQRPPPRARPPD